MRLVAVDRCPPGLRLGKPIYNHNGKVLLSKGIELTDTLLVKLKKYNIATLYIEDEESEGIEVIQSIPDELLLKAGRDVTESLQSIANANLHKNNLQNMVKSSRAMRSLQKVFKDIHQSLAEQNHTLNLLATAVIQEKYIFNHSLNVSIYACQVSLEAGLPINKIEEIGLGAMLHDVGKLMLPEHIHNKPGKLTEEEYEVMKEHTTYGFDLIRKSHEIPLSVAHCAFQHHERMDGLGYPRGLMEKDIHHYAKIISVADVFDAMTSNRVYRKGMLPHFALSFIKNEAGKRFDNRIVDLFSNCITIYPQGLTVKLSNGHTGIISGYHANMPDRPQVRVIRDENDEPVKPYELDLSVPDNEHIEIAEADALL